jgi:23S rRNA (adenine-N6)-dimethyltransferase
VAGRVRRDSRRGSGQHFLRSSKLAAELVRAARIGPDDVVLDIGAGTGLLTQALAGRARRVVAVEVDPELAAGLRRRLRGVEIVEADARNAELPTEPFKVVANLPFEGSTAILRRLLDPAVPLTTADVILQWETACKRAAVWPSTQVGAYWGAWFELSVARRLPRCVFSPVPGVDAGVLQIRRRSEPLLPGGERRAYAAFLERGFRHGVRAVVSPRALKRLEAELGLERGARPRDLDVLQWTKLYAHAVRRAR